MDKIILFTITVFAYGNSLFNSFIADDVGIIQRGQLPDWQSILLPPIGSTQRIFYFLLSLIGGKNPFFYHLFSMGLHVLNVFLVYSLLQRFPFIKKRAALFGAMLFAVHPALVESVTWISGSLYIIYTFFLLLSFLTFLDRDKNKKWLVCSLVFFILALLTSEKAAVFPLVLLLYTFLFEDIRKKWSGLLPYFIILIPFCVLIFFHFGSRVESFRTYYYQPLTFINPLIHTPVAIGTYLVLFFWPEKLTLYHTQLVNTGTFIFYALLLVGYLYLGFVSFKKDKVIFFCLSLFVISILPSLVPLSIFALTAERYVYFGSIGIFFAISYIWNKYLEKRISPRSSLILFSGILFLLTMRTVARNSNWYDAKSFWTSEVAASPNSFQPHDNLGVYYLREGSYQKAVVELETALSLGARFPGTYQDLGMSYHKLGNTNAALAYYLKAVELDTSLWQSYQNIAGIYFEKGDFQQAAIYNQKATKAHPKELSLYINLGITYLKMGQLQKAAEIFRDLQEIDPGNKNAHIGLQEVEKARKK